MVKEDYIMRIIHEAVRTLLKLLFGIEEEKTDDFEFQSPELETAYRKLKELAEAGGINEAENQLWERLDGQNQEAFQMAVLFYDFINDFKEEELEEASFSREEITDGLLRAARLYGYDKMVGVLLEQ